MVNYGPWTQDPDYQQGGSTSELSGTDPYSGLPLFEYARSGTRFEGPFQDPVDPVTVEELKDAFDAVNTLGPSGTGDPVGLTLWGSMYTWGYQLAFPNWQTHYAAETAHRVHRIQERDYAYSPTNYVPVPDGAIGIDYPGQPYDPDGYAWHSAPAAVVSKQIRPAGTLLKGWWRDDTADVVPDSTTEVWLKPNNGTPVMVAELGPPDVADDGGNPLSLTLDTPIPLTPYLSDTEWGGVVWTRQPVFVPPVGDPGPYGTGLVRYGWGFDTLWVEATVRPPLYRWVFEGSDEPETYRRIYPRDDTLGAGSARNYPPSKSVQNGNRTSGGYL